MTKMSRCLAVVTLLAVLGSWANSQELSPVKVSVKDGAIKAEEPVLPVDPNPRLRIGGNGNFSFGLSVDNVRLCCSPEGSIFSTARVDNQEVYPGNDGRIEQAKPLSAGPNGKKRHGTVVSANLQNNLHVTQTIEMIPGRFMGKSAPGQKRKLDTGRITFVVENKDSQPHTLEWRVGIDMLINNNDGALYAAPNQPGKILNGVVLKDKLLPDYVMCLENPDLKNPGFVAYMTLKPGGKGDSPNKIVLTNLGCLGQGWDVPAQQAGDSACALYWEPKILKPGEKREMVWAYGGGVAGNPDNEGKVKLSLGGNFEPGKLFTIQATVDDPVLSQMLTLELPKGMELVEGKERQNVAKPPEGSETSMVLWKARVVQTGEYELRVRSSTGVTQVKSISITAR